MPGAPMFSWAQSAETSTSLRLMGGVPSCGGCAGGQAVRAGRARRTVRYSSQPRQKPVTALSRAATSARPVATAPTSGAPVRYPVAPTTANIRPTSCAKRGGASGSRSRTGPSRGATSSRNSTPYGAYRSPANAPTAKTTAWTATSVPLPWTTAMARTTAVTHAAKRGPRTSISGGTAELIDHDSPDGGQGTSGRTGSVLRESDTGSCPRGTGRLCGERSARGPRREGNRSRARPGMRVYQCGELVGPRRAAAAPDEPAGTIEVEQRRGSADVEFPDLVEVALGVDLDHRQTRPAPLHLLQAGLGGAAGRAEGRGEPDDGQVGLGRADPQALEQRLRRHVLASLDPPEGTAPRPLPPRSQGGHRQRGHYDDRSDPTHRRVEPAGRQGYSAVSTVSAACRPMRTPSAAGRTLVTRSPNGRAGTG